MLKIKLLGNFSVEMTDGSTLPLPGRKDRALVAYLAAHLGTPIARDRLSALIWPNAAEGAGRASLRQSLNTIRKVLPEKAKPAIVANRDSVCLDAQLVATDVQKLEVARSDPSALGTLTTSFDGPVLDGFGSISAEFDSWVAGEASRLGALAVDALRQSAERTEQQNDYAQAIHLLTMALAIDPLAERVVRRLMQLQAAAGRSEAALRQYRALEVLLETELGVRPDAETQEVARAIRQGRVKSASPQQNAPNKTQPMVPGSVLVTRFVERSDAEDYFALSFTESVILALSRFRETPVMDLKTVKAAGGAHNEDPLEMGRSVGANFVLSGTVQRSGERLRINALLAQSESGQTIWAERFDTPLADLLDIEDELSARVATATAGRIEDEALRRARGKAPTDLAVIDWVMRGRYNLNLYTRSGETQAKRCFEEALALDPECVPALAGLAVSHLHDFENASNLSTEALETAQNLAQRAISLDPGNAHARYAMASSLCYLGGYDQALQHCNQALATNPNDYHNICTLGWILTFNGEIEKAIDCNARAIRLNPYAPNGCLLTSGFGLLIRGDFEEAIKTLSAIDSENMFKLGGLAACYNRLGHKQETHLAAKSFFLAAEQDFPGDTSQEFSQTSKYWRCLFAFANPSDEETFYGALNDAGIPV